MTENAIAVIDIGKTSAKLVLLDAGTGQERAVRTMPNTVLPGPPFPHADTEAIWAFLVDGLREFAGRHAISGISITTHGATAALMSGNKLALPVLDYEFDGPDTLASAYEAVRPPFAETLSPRLPVGLNLGAQLYWQQQAFPEDFAKVTRILPYPQYWAFRLTGAMASEVTSLGCHTDLWAPDENSYSSLVTGRGWADLFPPLCRADEIAGTVTPAVAAETGLDPDTPVACGIHDSNASLLPYLQTVQPPFNVISSGTWTIHMHVGGETGRLDPERDSLANVDYLGRPVPTARLMGGREYEALAGQDATAPSLADVQSIIEQKIYALPSFAPGVGAFPHKKGKIVGNLEAFGPSAPASLASLYLALCSRSALEICGQGNRILVEGPLARNPVYLTALTTLTGVPVIASGDATGTSTGAGMLFTNVSKDWMVASSGDKYEDADDLPGLLEYAADWRKMIENG